jgi:hypothetical protein
MRIEGVEDISVTGAKFIGFDIAMDVIDSTDVKTERNIIIPRNHDAGSS